MKLRPSRLPLGGVPGSPQNLAAEEETCNIADTAPDQQQQHRCFCNHTGRIQVQCEGYIICPCDYKCRKWPSSFLKFKHLSLFCCITQKEDCMQRVNWKHCSAESSVLYSQLISYGGFFCTHTWSDHRSRHWFWLLLWALLFLIGFLLHPLYSRSRL